MTSQRRVASTWIFGSEGVRRVAALDCRLKAKTLSRFVAEGGRATFYSPWMCTPKGHPLVEAWNPKSVFQYSADVLNKISRTYSDQDTGEGLTGLGLKGSSFRLAFDPEISESQRRLFMQAWMLCGRDRDVFGPLRDTLVCFIAPICTTGERSRRSGAGFSTLHARNAIFLSCPEEAPYPELELLANLFHEIAHQAVMVYQAADRILESDLDQLIYSGIRGCMRPAILSFHAAAALVAMIRAFSLARGWPEYAHSSAQSYLDRRDSELRAELVPTLLALEACRPTPLGKRMLKEFALAIRPEATASQ